jgi:hypothetical protein
MEAAAIRAVHGDPIAAAPTLIPVLDHWEHGGPGLIAQQWDTLRHVARLLVRLGAEDEAAALQRFFVCAGREPPLSGEDATRVCYADGVAPAEADVVEFARVALRPYC